MSQEFKKPTWQEGRPAFKPMLGAGITRDMTIDEFFSLVVYPAIATPKFDGIRCTLLPYEETKCSPVCRSLDPVPNAYIREKLSALPCGLDGEIMTYEQAELFNQVQRPKKFYQIQSDVMSEQGHPDFKFHVFDFHDWQGAKYPHMESYEQRLAKLDKLVLPSFCVPVTRKICSNRRDIELFEEACVLDNYEGICWRWAHSPYKYGRSTLKQQFLIKMKRFETMEATITDTYEEMHNANPAERNALGNLERSSHQENMRGKGRLGGFVCKAEGYSDEFRIGSGFNQAQRESWWSQREQLVGRQVTFKHQPHGAKDRPRIPIFVAIRDPRDL